MNLNIFCNFKDQIYLFNPGTFSLLVAFFLILEDWFQSIDVVTKWLQILISKV